MKYKIAVLFLAAMSAMSMSACGAPIEPPSVQVIADQSELNREAARSLPISQDQEAPVLELRESVSESIESLAADGSASAYKMNYVLTFRLDGDQENSIALEQIIPSQESTFLASRRARQEAIVRLRRSALRQMQYVLALKKNPQS